jgi:phosphoserine phosphatase RsbX
MELSPPPVRSPVEWGVAGRPLAGEQRSGDLHVVRELDDGVLLGVIDGLGHGDGAAEAASVAGDVLRGDASEPLDRLMARCHDALRHTRGAVVALAIVPHTGPMRWLAVGDAEGVLVPAGPGGTAIRHLPQHRGIVGRNLPPLRVEVFDLSALDVLLMATDGISIDGLSRGPVRATSQWLANNILARSARANDDALVLVARRRGQP